MAFEKRVPTAEEVEYLKSFGINFYDYESRYKIVICDKERNFYMFHVYGVGYEDEYKPMYLGIVWNDRAMLLGVFEEEDGEPLDGIYVKWKLCSFEEIEGKEEQQGEMKSNDAIIPIIKEALTATNGNVVSTRAIKVLGTEFIGF